ncbi:hypothetical protein PVAND_014342 [Polypedilum vanderplanki]|uniref:Uncharacterized protein n=1 Tax=Polypedilum vanderplanki TaxID=319348 RepID=A0A9J6CTJ7_POLVA|nr:hypothetical protein PVAND_014342 [Polypedilum vanderplanki]
MSFSEEISLKNEVYSETIESIAEDYNKTEDVFEVYLSEYYNEKDQPLVRSILKEMGYEFLCFLFEILGKRKHKGITFETTEESFDEQEISSNDFVKSIPANIDYNSLIDHWKKSSKIRLKTFKEASQKTDLAKLYRALERPDGYMLISIDFNTLHPVHLNFYTEWNKYQDQIYATLESNEHAKNKFHLLSTNQKAVKTLISISDFLYGPPLLRGSDKSYRASKSDALKFLLFRCLSENLFQLNITEWQQHLSQYSITKQAFIVCFGESFENLEDKFLVCLDDIIYTFEGEAALLSAIDTLLKIYYVFDIAYPIINQQVYEFMSAKFLGIDNIVTKKSKGNKVNQLLNIIM